MNTTKRSLHTIAILVALIAGPIRASDRTLADVRTQNGMVAVDSILGTGRSDRVKLILSNESRNTCRISVPVGTRFVSSRGTVQGLVAARDQTITIVPRSHEQAFFVETLSVNARLAPPADWPGLQDYKYEILPPESGSSILSALQAMAQSGQTTAALADSTTTDNQAQPVNGAEYGSQYLAAQYALWDLTDDWGPGDILAEVAAERSGMPEQSIRAEAEKRTVAALDALLACIDRFGGREGFLQAKAQLRATATAPDRASPTAVADWLSSVDGLNLVAEADVPFDTPEGREVSVSPDGRLALIAGRAAPPTGEAVTATSKIRLIDEAKLHPFGRVGGHARLSPDRESIVFTLPQPGLFGELGLGALVTTRADASHEKGVTLPGSLYGHSEWVDNGTLLAHCVTLGAGGEEFAGACIVRIPKDGGSPVALGDTGAFDFCPVWNRTDRQIYFISYKPGSPAGIYRMSEKGSERSLVMPGSFLVHPGIALSGHGNKLLAVTRTDPPGFCILQLPASPPDTVFIPCSQGLPRSFAWTPDGRTVIYSVSSRDGKNSLRKLTLGTGERLRLPPFKSVAKALEGPSRDDLLPKNPVGAKSIQARITVRTAASGCPVASGAGTLIIRPPDRLRVDLLESHESYRARATLIRNGESLVAYASRDYHSGIAIGKDRRPKISKTKPDELGPKDEHVDFTVSGLVDAPHAPVNPTSLVSSFHGAIEQLSKRTQKRPCDVLFGSIAGDLPSDVLRVVENDDETGDVKALLTPRSSYLIWVLGDTISREYWMSSAFVLWLDKKTGYPKRLQVAVGQTPDIDVTITDWNTEANPHDDLFDPRVPSGSSKVEL
ncbi:MAG: hypothetical protein Q7T82_20900 [Armatimonadota bacterium]|nr:hypothetical protein [Armatimonadota bacterium]